jgi:hypothetical protein
MDALPVRETRAVDSKGRSEDLEIIDIGPVSAAIAESPMDADGACLASHQEINTVDGVLIAVGITEPPFGSMRVYVHKRLQGKPGEADGP